MGKYIDREKKRTAKIWSKKVSEKKKLPLFSKIFINCGLAFHIVYIVIKFIVESCLSGFNYIKLNDGTVNIILRRHLIRTIKILID